MCLGLSFRNSALFRVMNGFQCWCVGQALLVSFDCVAEAFFFSYWIGSIVVDSKNDTCLLFSLAQQAVFPFTHISPGLQSQGHRADELLSLGRRVWFLWALGYFEDFKRQSNQDLGAVGGLTRSHFKSADPAEQRNPRKK